jgi:hypothetical protein
VTLVTALVALAVVAAAVGLPVVADARVSGGLAVSRVSVVLAAAAENDKERFKSQCRSFLDLDLAQVCSL